MSHAVHPKKQTSWLIEDMNQETDNFADPQLKQCVRRAWGAEAAPAALRERVASILAAERSAGKAPAADDMGLRGRMRLVSTARQRYFTPFRIGGLALAATLFIVIGLIGYRLIAPPVTSGALADQSLRPDVAASFVRTHDGCCTVADHHGVPGDDMAQIGHTLADQLKITVISTKLDGWQFAGAAPCPVWGHTSAHLLYRSGSKTLSVFSVPARDFGLSGESFTATLNGHPIAAFERNGGLYCVVGFDADGSVSVDDVRAIRDHLRADWAGTTIAYAPRKYPALTGFVVASLQAGPMASPSQSQR